MYLTQIMCTVSLPHKNLQQAEKMGYIPACVASTFKIDVAQIS